MYTVVQKGVGHKNRSYQVQMVPLQLVEVEQYMGEGGGGQYQGGRQEVSK